ncbi:hypothetical protein [Alterisphingorhabdus coralli]|uniref:hypothetical protein n=1 Tax=Alterisphingorhabdus coralli TaxID=3071408 RepID=UPI003873A098
MDAFTFSAVHGVAKPFIVFRFWRIKGHWNMDVFKAQLAADTRFILNSLWMIMQGQIDDGCNAIIFKARQLLWTWLSRGGYPVAQAQEVENAGNIADGLLWSMPCLMHKSRDNIAIGA